MAKYEVVFGDRVSIIPWKELSWVKKGGWLVCVNFVTFLLRIWKYVLIKTHIPWYKQFFCMNMQRNVFFCPKFIIKGNTFASTERKFSSIYGRSISQA